MLSKNIYHINIYVKNLSIMASNEGIDEAEQLRLLALQSMVRRSKPKNSHIKINEKDDQDILLLRAAALKTIVHKNNSQTSLLINEDGKLLNVRNINRKRSYETSPLKRKKLRKPNENMIKEHLFSFTDDLNIKSHKESLENINENHNCNVKSDVENKVVADTNDNVKKIVKNGSIQLSNLDSEKIDETLVLHITFSSSDSDDSSSDYDSKYLLKQKNKVRDSIKCNKKQQIIAKTLELKPLEDKKANNNIPSDSVTKYMQKLTGLMKHCELELKERNQQMTILLDAYEKYKNHSQTLCSIIQTMKSVRDELSKCCCVETDH